MREMKPSGVEWIGDIPQGWEVAQLGSLFIEHKYKNVGMASDNLLSLSYGKIIRKNVNSVEGLLPESFEGYNIVDDGDIVIRLTDLQNDQRSLRVGLCHERGIITSAYVTIRKRNITTIPAFFYYAIHSYDVYKGFYGMGSGVRQGLNFSGIRKLALPLPSRSEQEAIVAFLDRKCGQVDALVKNVQAQIEQLKAYKQSLISETVTKGLNPNAPMKDSGVEWIGKIPQGWEVNKVNRLFSVIGSGTTPKDVDDTQHDQGINWIQSGDINGGILRETRFKVSQKIVNETSALKLYQAPFIVIAMYGASIGNLSTSIIDACTNQACCVLASPKESVILDYLFYAFKPAKDYLIWKADGGGQPNISQDKVKNLWLPVPPLPEQQAIADFLDRKCGQIDRLIAVKQAKIEQLEAYKKSLIYEVVTGKIDCE